MSDLFLFCMSHYSLHKKERVMACSEKCMLLTLTLIVLNLTGKSRLVEIFYLKKALLCAFEFPVIIFEIYEVS